jgi:hypothetical protein
MALCLSEVHGRTTFSTAQHVGAKSLHDSVAGGVGGVLITRLLSLRKSRVFLSVKTQGGTLCVPVCLSAVPSDAWDFLPTTE